MVNKNKSITPVSTGSVSIPSSVSGASNASGNSAGGNNTSGSSAGGGTVSSTPPSGSLPPATMPGSGFRNEVTTMVQAFGSSIPDGSNVLVSGQQMSKQSILTALQAVMALYAAVDASVQTAKSNRLTLKAALPAAHQLVAGLKAGLIALFGKGNPVLVAFGFSGNKTHALTVEQKTARKAKAQATRELRGTLGSREKLGVKYQGTIQVQTTQSGTPGVGGSATSPTGSGTAGASTTPAASGNASGSGSNTSSGT